MSVKDKPSTKARKEGYDKLHRLERLLCKLLCPKLLGCEVDEDHWFNQAFKGNIGWKDFMIRHTPSLKRGGPDRQPSKRRRSKQKDRQSTIR